MNAPITSANTKLRWHAGDFFQYTKTTSRRTTPSKGRNHDSGWLLTTRAAKPAVTNNSQINV